MRQRLEFAAALSLLVGVVTGCEKTTAGAADGRQLSVMKPSNVTLKRGESGEVIVNIERKNFRDPVMVSFSQLPTGVEVNDKDKQIPAEATSASFTLKAGAQVVPVTDHRVEIGSCDVALLAKVISIIM